MQYNPDEYDEILNIFKSESEEIIQELNNNFLELEKSPQNKTPIKRLLQLAHSLKGASRMLGFNNVQDISHKLEDILSYWKNDNVVIKTDSFQIIYDTCDFLSELLSECIKNKSDRNNPKIPNILNKLGNLIFSDNKVPVKNFNNVPDDYIYKENMDINAIVLELMFVIERDDEENTSEDIVSVIAQNLKELSDIFNKTDYNNIKDKINELYFRVNNNFELKFFKKEIPNLRKIIYKLYKDLNIKSNINNQIKNNDIKEEKTVREKQNPILDKLDYIIKNIQKIKYEKDILIKITEIMKETINYTDNDKVILILNKIITLLELIISKDIIIDNDCYMVILHTIYMVKSIYSKESVNEGNLTFLIQRLNVLSDMFNISGTQEKETNNIVPKNINGMISSDGYASINNNIKSFEIQEIRTLRIDSSKLDNLISQASELLVNSMKAREHITELADINSKLIKWNTSSKKISDYLKYLEKKGVFNTHTEDAVINFFKKAQNFFNSNADIINEINNDFTNIFNMIFQDNNKLHQSALEVEAIAKGIRVLPLATIFHSFPRMIRDIAKENGKKVNFIISGSDTIIDKKILEEIKTPLIHILRNAIYHGIEKSEDRIKNGKDETGTIRLIAKQIENNIVIIIEDDGYGINFAKVKEIAKYKGLLTEEEINNMTDEQIMKLLFLPGFSTSENINEISGRGIGLDVVKTKLINLNGDISIDSVLNKGCRVTIKLPVSFSTLKTFIIQIGNDKYAIPINSIKYVKQIKNDEIFIKDGIKSIRFENHTIPVYSLSELFGERQINDGNYLTVIIIEHQDKQSAFIADKLLGTQEVFQKKLVPPIIKLKNINGITTLSAGEICLIINPYELMQNTLIMKN